MLIFPVHINCRHCAQRWPVFAPSDPRHGIIKMHAEYCPLFRPMTIAEKQQLALHLLADFYRQCRAAGRPN